jgi:hypothetical protein
LDGASQHSANLCLAEGGGVKKACSSRWEGSVILMFTASIQWIVIKIRRQRTACFLGPFCNKTIAPLRTIYLNGEVEKSPWAFSQTPCNAFSAKLLSGRMLADSGERAAISKRDFQSTQPERFT